MRQNGYFPKGTQDDADVSCENMQHSRACQKITMALELKEMKFKSMLPIFKTQQQLSNTNEILGKNVIQDAETSVLCVTENMDFCRNYAKKFIFIGIELGAWIYTKIIFFLNCRIQSSDFAILVPIVRFQKSFLSLFTALRIVLFAANSMTRQYNSVKFQTRT